MQYGKLLGIAILATSLTACEWIPPTNEQPPRLPAADLQPLKTDAPDAQDIVDTDSLDDGAPVVVPPGLKKGN